VEQERLFDGPVRAAAVTLWADPDGSWRLMVVARRDFAAWGEVAPGYYDGLTLAEALDVVEATLLSPGASASAS
jgi:hypothetical protein